MMFNGNWFGGYPTDTGYIPYFALEAMFNLDPEKKKNNEDEMTDDDYLGVAEEEDPRLR